MLAVIHQRHLAGKARAQIRDRLLLLEDVCGAVGRGLPPGAVSSGVPPSATILVSNGSAKSFKCRRAIAAGPVMGDLFVALRSLCMKDSCHAVRQLGRLEKGASCDGGHSRTELDKYGYKKKLLLWRKAAGKE